MSAWTQKAGSGEGKYPKAPVGNHPARLIAIVDLGTQENNYNGQITKSRKAFFCWELVNEPMPGYGRNFVIGCDLTVSLNEKAKLRKWIEARVGKQMPDGNEYDVSQELGKPCLLNVTEKNGYPRVDGMGSVPKGMVVPEATLEKVLWGIDELGEYDPEFPDWMPRLYGNPLVDHIRGSEEAKRGVQGPIETVTVPTDDNGNDPF